MIAWQHSNESPPLEIWPYKNPSNVYKLLQKTKAGYPIENIKHSSSCLWSKAYKATKK